MASLSWTEPSAFTRAKLDTGAPPLARWVKPVLFVVLAGVLLAFPVARERPQNGSWLFTVVGSFAISFLFVFALPFLIARSGDKWTLNESGVGMSGFRGIMQTGGHWKWADVTGYRLSTREIEGRAYHVLEFYYADGLLLRGALSPRVTPHSITEFLSRRGIQVVSLVS